MSNSRNSRNRRIVRRALARRQGKNYINPTSSGRKKSLGSTKGYGTKSFRNYTYDFTSKTTFRGNDDTGMVTKKDLQTKWLMHPESYDKMIRNYGPITRGADGSFNNVGTIRSYTRNEQWGNENGECNFICNGREIWVAPGDCVRCPEQAYCPDNLNCRVRAGDNPNQGEQYLDSGFACCGCAAAYGGMGGPNGDQESYGKRLGRSYLLWLGDNDADDGRYISNYYGCRKEFCHPDEETPCAYNQSWPTCDDGGVDENTWEPDGEYFIAGPFEPRNQYERAHMFYWAGDAPDLLDTIADGSGYFDCGGCMYQDIDLSGYGGGFPHMACPEWGWDCGDVLNTRRAGEISGGCAGPDRWVEDAVFGDGGLHDQLPSNVLFTPNSSSDCVNNTYDLQRKRFLGWETYGPHEGLGPSTDPNKHCGFTIGAPDAGTCKNKCNRKRYIHRYLESGDLNPYFIPHPDCTDPDECERGFDPGGFAFVSRGTDVFGDGPSTCHCDYACVYCGCDLELFRQTGVGGEVPDDFAMDAYNECLAACPSDCLPPNHEDQTGEPIGQFGYDTGEGGQYAIKTGTVPGVDCNPGMSTALMGDCCNDYIMECVTERSPLPCECYDLKNYEHGDITEQELDFDDDKVNYGDGWWVSAQQMQHLYGLQWEPGLVFAGTITLPEGQSNDSNCAGRCDQFCKSRGWGLEASRWDTLLNQQDVDNKICVMEHINRLVLGYSPDNPEFNMFPWQEFTWLNYWVSVPTCNASLADSSYQGGGACNCACGCDEYVGYSNGDWFAPKRRANADIGCGGLLPEGEVPENFCNYSGNYGISEDYNCTVEYIESLQDPWYTSNLSSLHADAPRCNRVSELDLDSNNWINRLDEGIVPRRIVSLYLLLKSYEDGNCNVSEYNQLLGLTGAVPLMTACEDGYNLYTERVSKFNSGCMGCADPNAGNYTGDVIKIPGTNTPMGCSGFGTEGDNSCCYYESGCNDQRALNHLINQYSNNKNNRPAGGLASLNPLSTLSYPMKSIDDGVDNKLSLCSLLDGLFPDISINDQTYSGNEYCPEALAHLKNNWDENTGVPSPDFPYCFAPNGCDVGGEAEEVCVYEEMKYCGVNTACNFSLDCALAETEDLVLSNLDRSLRCVRDDSTCLNIGNGKISFCTDSDGDCLIDEDSTPMAFGCNPELLPTEYPADAEYYYTTDYFTTYNGLAGYLYQEDPSFGTSGEACIGQLANGPIENGFPLRPCTNQVDTMIACPTNTTHASTNRSRWCTGYEGGSVPTTYPFLQGGEVQEEPKSWEGQPFDINHCCIESQACNVGNANGATINGVDYPCCYQDDDCGNCDLPNQGMIVQLDGSDVPLPYYNTSLGHNNCYEDNVGGTMNIWNDTLSDFPIGIGTAQYLNTRTGITSCNCSGDTSLSCNCNIPEQNYIGNVCGMNYAPDCAGICPYQGQEPTSTDECGVCDGPGTLPGYNGIGDSNCCPYESPYCINGGPNCGPPDCADVCGGSSVIEEFSIDGDGDFFCQPNSMVEYCTADVVNDTPGDDYRLTQQCEGDDANDEIYCPTNNIDDCNVCDGGNLDKDCSGVCFGDAFVDDCGTCSCPPGQISAEAGCPNGVVQEPNSEKDQCGLCPGETLISKDILGFDVTLTWGSFGCESGDWYGTQFDISNQSAFCGPFGGDQFGEDRGNGILHCGCQCAGCTNPSSPAWTPYSKYDIERNDTIDWLFGDPNYANLNGVDIYIDRNYCWDEPNFHLHKYSKQVIDVAYDRFGAYCSQASIDYLEQLGGSDLIPYCVRIDSSLCILGNEVVDCSADGAQTMDDFLQKTVESNGWYWHGNIHFKYCENPLPGNLDCTGDIDMNCTQTYGSFCCGLAGGREHCRSGIRSELHWYIQRAEGGDAELVDDPDFPYIGGTGDVNFDGIVNVQDIIVTVGYIMGNISLSQSQIQAADVTGDGTINILDVVQLVNLILSSDNARGRSSQTQLTPVETNRLINMLKPYFNNSVYTAMQLVDGMGRKVRRMNNTSRTTNTRNCGSDYCFDYFNFVLNAPTCIPQDVEVEFGDGFDNWASQANVIEGPNNSIILGVVGNNQTSVEQNIDTGHQMFFTIYHPNVRIQSDDTYRQTLSFLPGNVIKFLPPSDITSCVGIRPENNDYCSSVTLEECNSEEVCEIQFQTAYEYESRGVFGYGFDTWNTFDNGCAESGNDCTGLPTRYYYLPDEHQCS